MSKTERIHFEDGAWWEIRTRRSYEMTKRVTEMTHSAAIAAGVDVSDAGELEAYRRNNPNSMNFLALMDAYLLLGTVAYSFDSKVSMDVINSLDSDIVEAVIERMNVLYAPVSEAQAANLGEAPPSMPTAAQ